MQVGCFAFFFFLIIPPFNQKIDFKKFDTCSLYVVQDISRKNSTCRTETSYQLCLTFKKYHLTFKQCMPGRPITQLSMFTWEAGAFCIILFTSQLGKTDDSIFFFNQKSLLTVLFIQCDRFLSDCADHSARLSREQLSWAHRMHSKRRLPTLTHLRQLLNHKCRFCYLNKNSSEGFHSVWF